ncbi:MAG: SUMF1/EgtB/PvdO family nonheme iron enzyme [Bacteroidota bacterium]
MGINDYEHVSKLNNAVKDVEDFAALMEKEYNFQKKHIHILKDKQATRRKITNKLKSYASSLTEKDNLLLYFSGHGIKDKLTKEGFWIPVEGEKEEEDSWLANETVMRYIRSMKAHHIFMLIDACFAGSFFVKARSDASKYDQAPSRFAITSGAEEIVSDGPEGQNSPFASSMLNFLKSHQQSVVGAGGLFEEIKNHIPAGQKPQARHLSINGKLYEGEFCFYRKEDVSAKEERAFKQADKIGTEQAWLDFIEACERKEFPGEHLKDAEDQLRLVGEKRKWERIKEFPSLYDLRRFIRNNPGSPFMDEAERLYEKLKNNPEELEIDFVKTFEDALKDDTNSSSLPKVNPTPKEPKNHPFLKTLGLEMIKVEGGSFMMGSNEDETEKPIHRVTLEDFYIGKHPVTQGQWERVIGRNPARFKGDLQKPVEQVSWEDCQQFIQRLNKQTGLQYRLPSEAEWEFAAKGGNYSKGFKYSGSNELEAIGWYKKNSKKRTHPVGQKKPNELEIHDMSGNVWEWCEDDWHTTYKYAPNDGSAWVGSGIGYNKVIRGGSWANNDDGCLGANRGYNRPSVHENYIGFRLSRYLVR